MPQLGILPQRTRSEGNIRSETWINLSPGANIFWVEKKFNSGKSTVNVGKLISAFIGLMSISDLVGG